jgi:chromosome segregation ATPase
MECACGRHRRPRVPDPPCGLAPTARYAQHVSSMLREATATSAHLHLRLEERAGQRKAQDRAVKTLREGNRELIQKNARLETRIKELNDELMRTYRSRDFKTDSLDDARTQLQHTQDDLTAAQSYVHHLKTELHERDEQLEASQAQVADLQNEVEHLQGLIPPEPEEPEEDPEEIEGMSGLDDE